MKIFGSTDILLPKSADMHRWAVIACDLERKPVEFLRESVYRLRVNTIYS